jgi:hypothetical protein
MKAILPLLLVLAGCATVGPTGGTRFDVQIKTEVRRLGVAPLPSRAVVVITPEERAFKAYAPIPMGAWDYQWGRNLPAVARAAFSQVFYSAEISENPSEDADYEVRISFDRAKTAATVTMRALTSSLTILVDLYQGRERIWERQFEVSETKKGGTEDLAALGGQLSALMGDAAKAVYEEAKSRPVAARRPAAPASAPEPAPRAERESASVATRPQSDVDSLPARRAARRGHAVIIGVENYRERLPKADFAAADAKTMAAYASAVLGYAEENVVLMTDGRATKGDFEKNLERWLVNRVEKDDEVFVYFSGHGAPNPKTGDAYLVPYDGDPTYIQETGYPLKKLYATLVKLPTKNVTVALDSCFSGAGGRSVIAKGARPLVEVHEAAPPEEILVLAASAGDEISNSYDEQGHGLFTYYFLKGLKSKGPDFKAVFEYLKPEVARVARRQYNADQNPQWKGKP